MAGHSSARVRQTGSASLDVVGLTKGFEKLVLLKRFALPVEGERILLSDMEGVFSIGDTGAKFQKGIRNYS